VCGIRTYTLSLVESQQQHGEVHGKNDSLHRTVIKGFCSLRMCDTFRTLQHHCLQLQRKWISVHSLQAPSPDSTVKRHELWNASANKDVVALFGCTSMEQAGLDATSTVPCYARRYEKAVRSSSCFLFLRFPDVDDIGWTSDRMYNCCSMNNTQWTVQKCLTSLHPNSLLFPCNRFLQRTQGGSLHSTTVEQWRSPVI
jgi:hypothetical protein